MTIHLPDARQLSDSILEALRLRALRGCELGYTHADLADLLGVTRETITRWWNAYKVGGLEGLPQDRSGRPVGSGALLDEQQAARIQQLIDDHTPEELGITAPLWTRRAVRDLIAKQFDIHLATRTVGDYLARWGYTAKRPTRRSKLQDPDEVQDWVENTYPEIETQAEEEDAKILWADETGVEGDEHAHYGYSRQGEPAIMEVPRPHLRVNVIITLGNDGELHYKTYDRMMTGAFFIEYLQELIATTDQKILLIVDRLPSHKSKAVEDWLAAHKEQIEVYYLPPYAPEHNVEEYLNQDLKSNVHAERLPDTKGELLGQVQIFLEDLKALPARVMAYFQHPKVQFAAG